MTALDNHTKPIILTTGMFDLLKEQIRRKRLSHFNELKLTEQLRNSEQVLRKDLPGHVVDVNKTVKVRELVTGETWVYNFVPHDKVKRKHQTLSILSQMGIALLGFTKGAITEWETAEGIRKYQIEEISDWKS